MTCNGTGCVNSVQRHDPPGRRQAGARKRDPPRSVIILNALKWDGKGRLGIWLAQPPRRRAERLHRADWHHVPDQPWWPASCEAGMQGRLHAGAGGAAGTGSKSLACARARRRILRRPYARHRRQGSVASTCAGSGSSNEAECEPTARAEVKQVKAFLTRHSRAIPPELRPPRGASSRDSASSSTEPTGPAYLHRRNRRAAGSGRSRPARSISTG